MKKTIDWITKSGIWIPPIVFTIGWLYCRFQQSEWLKEPSHIVLLAFFSCIPWLLIMAETAGKPNKDKAMTGKKEAMYPPLAKRIQNKDPVGLVLGKSKNSKVYACKNPNEDGHGLIIGGSGSGKSSGPAIESIIAYIRDGFHVFVLDIKSELSYKAAKFSEVIRFNPLDRNTWGYDPLYTLNDKSSAQQIYETMQIITASLISLPADIKDPFWKLSARSLCLGQLIYFYKTGYKNLVDIIDQMLARPTKQIIEEVINTASPQSIEYRTLVQFSSMADETLGGIIAEINNHISIFVNDQDVRYAFKNNPQKFSPLSLEENSIFLSIPEHKLTAYYDVLQLIINQTLAQMEQRPEDSEPILMVLDELPRILSAGKIERLLDGARTLRSRRVTLFMITQSLEALMTAYTENEVDDLVGNCSYMIFLDSKSKKTQQAMINWAGKYLIRKQSWNSAKRNYNTSISFDEKDILNAGDLMSLRLSEEAIIITPYGYNRVRKCPWFNDAYFKPIVAANMEFNDLYTTNLRKEGKKNE